jgi:hypothetical protein
MALRRTLVIDNRDIERPDVARLRQLFRNFKKDVTNSKSEDELFDFLDELGQDNEKMMDYIINMNRNINRVQVVESYDK